MLKSSKILLAAIILTAIVAGVFLLYKFEWGRPLGEKELTPGGMEAALDPVSGRAIGDKMPETNPFAAGVNPFELYPNPFRK